MLKQKARVQKRESPKKLAYETAEAGSKPDPWPAPTAETAAGASPSVASP